MADPRRIRERLGFGYGAPSPAMDALTPFHAGVDPAYMPQDVVTESPWEGPRSWVRSGLENLFGTFAPSENAAAVMADKYTNLSDWINPAQEAWDIGQEAGNTLQGGDPTMLAMSLIPGKAADNIVPAVKAAQKGIKAYHGTPHDFEKFDLSKIGTGEGAQAYGHGLYFADSEDVARSYRDALAPHSASFEGNPLDTPKAYWGTHDALEQDDWRQAKALDYYSKQSGPAEERLRATRDWYRDQPDMMAAIDALEPKLGTKSQGHMYEVNINADPDAFLDWDKPLSAQSEKVRSVLSQVQDGSHSPRSMNSDEFRRMYVDPVSKAATGTQWESVLNNPAIINDLLQSGPEKSAAFISEVRRDSPTAAQKIEDFVNLYQEPTGDDIYRSLATSPYDSASTGAFLKAPGGAATAASDKLKQAGIPGIKYLDAGSRSGGDGSRNYVVFSDEIIDIVKKYGIAGALGAGLITQQMADQLEAQQGGGQS